MTDKICRKCGGVKPISAFPIHHHKKGEPTIRPECKPCYAAYMRDYYAACPDRRQRRSAIQKRYSAENPLVKKRIQLRLKYGIPLEEYEAMIVAQNGVCAICKEPSKDVDKRTGRPRALAVDHCHDTGVVRGLLCGDCNRSLGMMKEDINLLMQMIAYITKHAPSHKIAA